MHKQALQDNPERWHGAELSVTILGNWAYYRSKVLKYLQQVAVITPYAQFDFSYRAEDEKASFAVTFARRTDTMPSPPQVRRPRSERAGLAAWLGGWLAG